MAVKHRVERGVLVAVETADDRITVLLIGSGILLVRTRGMATWIVAT